MIIKYFFDRFGAFVGLILIWPMLIVIAVLIRMKMPDGPIIFRQQRIGRHGSRFTMYKFRTMSMVHSGSSISVAGETRITPLGAILRRYKLDELPELFNVLIGDMSFVGPRPDVPGYADRLHGDDRRILCLRPGITGPASLKYRDEEELIANMIIELRDMQQRRLYNIKTNATDEDVAHWYNDNVIFPDKVRINLYYFDHYSFWLDIRIIISTIFGIRMKYNDEII